MNWYCWVGLAIYVPIALALFVLVARAQRRAYPYEMMTDALGAGLLGGALWPVILVLAGMGLTLYGVCCGLERVFGWLLKRTLFRGID